MTRKLLEEEGEGEGRLGWARRRPCPHRTGNHPDLQEALARPRGGGQGGGTKGVDPNLRLRPGVLQGEAGGGVAAAEGGGGERGAQGAGRGRDDQALQPLPARSWRITRPSRI